MNLRVLEEIELKSEYAFALSNHSITLALELSLIDVETADLGFVDRSFKHALSSLSSNTRLRFHFCSCASNFVDADDSRHDSLNQLGFVQNRAYVFVEKNLSAFTLWNKKPLLNLQREAEKLLSSFDLSSLKNCGMRVRQLSREELNERFISQSNTRIVQKSYGVDLGAEVVGVVRLVKTSAHEVSPLLLASLKDSLPLPFEIRVSIEKVPQAESESFLRRRANQLLGGKNQVDQTKQLDTEGVLTEIALSGQALFETEVLVVLRRDSEGELRRACSEVLQTLKPLGDWYVESVGALPSLLASEVGNKQHHTFLENDDSLLCYLPLLTSGRTRDFDELRPRFVKSRTRLTLHRRDQGLDHIDLFDPWNENYSACVFGASGRGKSVFANLLTRALLNDPKTRIIKVDVGGSHSRETELLGGRERRFSLSQASGLNPFGVLSERPHSKDVCNVIASFVGVLLLEEGETTLTKTIRGDIEDAVTSYSASRPEKPSLDGFYNYATSLPRRELLKRWTSEGIFSAAFSGDLKEAKSNRLTYFNFSEIFQAADPDFSQGLMSAVIAEFNFQLMYERDSKLVFMVDETPFFIERCFQFFKFSTANVRKFGGSVVIIAQKSSDVVVGSDTGILDNTATKVLFSVDGRREEFEKRLKVDTSVVEKIESLSMKQSEFSECVVLDRSGARVMRISITPQEKWRFSSSPNDTEKLESLRKAVPQLSVEEAIQFLTISNF